MHRRTRFCDTAGPMGPLARLTGTLPPALLLGTLALASLGCAEDAQAPTGPTGPDQAVTAAVYTVKDLGTLGGPYSRASAINNVARGV